MTASCTISRETLVSSRPRMMRVSSSALAAIASSFLFSAGIRAREIARPA